MIKKYSNGEIHYPGYQVTKAQRRKILERDNYRCRICKSTENLEIDHIIPIFLGGGNDLENLRVLCRKCNSRRNITDYNVNSNNLRQPATACDSLRHT